MCYMSIVHVSIGSTYSVPHQRIYYRLCGHHKYTIKCVMTTEDLHVDWVIAYLNHDGCTWVHIRFLVGFIMPDL